MLELKYLLGVDGGNSKTDYLLCKEDGTFVDILRRPTCSHEHVGVGYDGMQVKMQSHLDDLFVKHNISAADISAAAFGLAGADIPIQIEELTKRVQNMGFDNFALGNDGILGVKAVADAGVCSINGSGTVVVGINSAGDQLQVGGIGPLSGDYAGGSHIARQAVEAMYKYYYRVGDFSSAFVSIMGVFGITNPSQLAAEVIANGTRIWQNATQIIQIVDSAAVNGDQVCATILDNIGINCAEGVSGCVRNLKFTQGVTVVKAGSIWTKLQYGGMRTNFENIVRSNTDQDVNFIVLDAPPALGAVLWAMGIKHGSVDAAARSRMQEFLTIEKYEQLVQGE